MEKEINKRELNDEQTEQVTGGRSIVAPVHIKRGVSGDAGFRKLRVPDCDAAGVIATPQPQVVHFSTEGEETYADGAMATD